MKWFNKVKHNVSTCLCTRCGKEKYERVMADTLTDLLFNADAAHYDPRVRHMRREALVEWNPRMV